MSKTTEMPDELEPFIAEQMQNPAFAARFTRGDVIEALTARRREIGMTQADIAAALDVSQATISEFESAAQDPRLSTLFRYAAAVRCTLDVKVQPATDATEAGSPA